MDDAVAKTNINRNKIFFIISRLTVMRRAWLLIAGAEAPYFLANRGRFQNPPLPSRAREDVTLFLTRPYGR